VAFTLRDAEADDLETLWRIDQKCFAEGIAYSKPELRFFMRRRGSFTLVGTDDGSREVAGFIVAQGGAVGHIITIDVTAAARRAGLGSQLLVAAEARLRLAGSRAVSLESAVDNVSALKFYERHGYTVVETRPGYYSNGVDALVLNKRLSNPQKAAQK
jgi:ribosomal-protein-alanine N-acetyltransferase